jgi:hypothetical protein
MCLRVAPTCLYAANGKVAWRDRVGQPIDFIAELRAAKGRRIDRPIWIERKGGANLALLLVAIRRGKPPQKLGARPDGTLSGKAMSSEP